MQAWFFTMYRPRNRSIKDLLMDATPFSGVSEIDSYNKDGDEFADPSINTVLQEELINIVTSAITAGPITTLCPKDASQKDTAIALREEYTSIIRTAYSVSQEGVAAAFDYGSGGTAEALVKASRVECCGPVVSWANKVFCRLLLHQLGRGHSCECNNLCMC